MKTFPLALLAVLVAGCHLDTLFNASGGNTITSLAGVVTIALGNDGSPLHNARLSGGAAAPASGGVATFAGLSVDQLGSGYSLTATFGTGNTAVESPAFNVTLVP